MQPGTFQPVTDMVGGGVFRLEPGQFTDDTSMALCLAASLVECRRHDPLDQIRRYVRWLRHGYMSSTDRAFDVGNATAQALAVHERTGEAFCGSEDPRKAGNGSVMRLAPVPLAYAFDPRRGVEYSAESSMTTHRARAAVDGCRYLAALIIGALAGASKDELLRSVYEPERSMWDDQPLHPEIRAVAAGSYRQAGSSIVASGYVVDTMNSALWAFWKGRTFEEGLLLAVNLGDDADTVGAVYGQLAGAYYGEEGIPPEWRKRLAMSEQIRALAVSLYELRKHLEGA